MNRLWSLLEWLIRLPRLYREEASLTAELRRLNAEFASLRELIGNEHNANAVSRNLVLAKLQQYGAQLDDRLQHHMTRAIASISRTSTRPASKLSEPELRNLMKSLNCKYATPINETNLEDLQSSGQEYNWLPTSEPAQTQAVIDFLSTCLNIPTGVTLIDANKGTAAKGANVPIMGMYGLAFTVKAKNDVLLAPRRAATKNEFAFIGVELKKTLLTGANINQARAEFLTWAFQSYSAFMQVLTDLQSGGVVWWVDLERAESEIQLIREEYIVGMPALYTVLNDALAALPPAILALNPDGSRFKSAIAYSKILDQPMRCKLEGP